MKIFRAVEKGIEIPENLDDLPDEEMKTEEKSEAIESVQEPEHTEVQEEAQNTDDATVADETVAEEADNHESDSEE